MSSDASPHLAPCAVHLAPCAVHLAPCAVHLAPCAVHLAPCTKLPKADEWPPRLLLLAEAGALAMQQTRAARLRNQAPPTTTTDDCALATHTDRGACDASADGAHDASADGARDASADGGDDAVCREAHPLLDVAALTPASFLGILSRFAVSAAAAQVLQDYAAQERLIALAGGVDAWCQTQTPPDSKWVLPRGADADADAKAYANADAPHPTVLYASDDEADWWPRLRTLEEVRARLQTLADRKRQRADAGLLTQDGRRLAMALLFGPYGPTWPADGPNSPTGPDSSTGPDSPTGPNSSTGPDSPTGPNDPAGSGMLGSHGLGAGALPVLLRDFHDNRVVDSVEIEAFVRLTGLTVVLKSAASGLHTYKGGTHRLCLEHAVGNMEWAAALWCGDDGASGP